MLRIFPIALILALAALTVALAGQSRSELLATLGRELARIRATPADQSAELDKASVVHLLVGMPSREIQKKIGVAPSKTACPCSDSSLMVARC